VIERLRALRRTPDTASEWFAARQRFPGDPALERAFAAWLAAKPERRREYALREVAWELSRPAAEAHASATVGRSTGRATRRRLLVGSGLAALLALATFAWWTTAAVQAAQFATAVGEQRTVVLDDGSRVTLNTHTVMDVRLYRDRREIDLRSGEAFFEVTGDTQRPFTVHTRLGEARVLGTKFTVWVQQQSVEITTEQGLVQVAASVPAAGAPPVYVRPGERALIGEGRGDLRVERADLVRINNWREQRIEFDAVPLVEALAEFSRYTPKALRTDDADTGAIKISGVFRTGDVAALAASLKGSFGLEIVNAPDGTWVVRRVQR
jgi:transmembrane sensor